MCFKSLAARAACLQASPALLFWWTMTWWSPGVSHILLSHFIQPSQRLREERSGLKFICTLLIRTCCNALLSTRRVIHQHLPISGSGVPTCFCWSCPRAFVLYLEWTDHSTAQRPCGLRAFFPDTTAADSSLLCCEKRKGGGNTRDVKSLTAST